MWKTLNTMREKYDDVIVSTWLPGGVVWDGQVVSTAVLAQATSSENFVCSCRASWVWPYCSNIASREDTSSIQRDIHAYLIGAPFFLRWALNRVPSRLGGRH